MKKIVSFFGSQNEIFHTLNESASEYARTKGLDYEWVPMNPFNEESVITHLNSADAGIIDVEPYGESIFSKLSDRVKLLVRFGVGYDKVDLLSATKHKIAVARTPGANTLGVAEMALTLLLSARRQLKLISKLTDRGQWDKIVVKETIGATIGIMGFGSIGKAVARLLKGFDCKIIAYDPMTSPKEAALLGVELVDLETLFKESDAVTIHIPYMESTHHIVNASLIALMKPDAVIVNTSRGNIVNENDLYIACRDKKILGAALDVFSEEPLPLCSPLLTLDNVILTPHLSSQTKESLWRIYAMAIDIAADFFTGKATPFILNPDYKDFV